MIFFEFIREALRNLYRHKLRSFLTVLGIVFGISSVVTMVATGEGARRSILAQIEELGIRNIIINAHKPPEEEDVQKAQQGYMLSYGLTFHDLRQIRKTIPIIDKALKASSVPRLLYIASVRFLSATMSAPEGRTLNAILS